MLKFYYNLGPNPMKVALFLEEAELAYDGIPVEMFKGEQFNADYLKINPNAKVPAIVDGDVTVFDSNAILLYLADKTGKFLAPGGLKGRGELLSWLMFIASGLSPFSGQAVHFRQYAKPEQPYSFKRYDYEANRHYSVLEKRLEGRRFILGDTYTIVDIAAWGWATRVPFIMGEDAWERFPNVKRFCDQIGARPAAHRVTEFRARHKFHTDFDETARKHMFRFINAADNKAPA